MHVLRLILIAVIAHGGTTAFGATLTWSGAGGDDAIGTADNWSQANVPVDGDSLDFAGTTRLTPQLSASLTVKDIEFKAGAGAFTLGGPGAYTISGDIKNSSSSLQTITNAIHLAASQDWDAKKGDLLISGDVDTAGYELTIRGSETTTLSGIVSGTGSLKKEKAGTLILSGDNTYTGGSNLKDGTVLIGSDSALGTGTVILGGATLGATGASRTLGNAITVDAHTDFTGSEDLIFTGAAVLTGNRIFTTSGTGLIAFSGNITQSGNRALTKEGTGTLALSGTNTFGNGIILNEGTLIVGSNSAVGTGGINLGNTVGTASAALLFTATSGRTIANPITVRAGTTGNTLTLGGLNTSGINTFSGDIALGREVVLSAEAGGEVHFTGAISGTLAGVRKIGAGTVQLSGSNTYTGTTTIAEGTLHFASPASLYNNTPSSWTVANLAVNGGATAAFSVGGPGEFTAANIAMLSALGTATAGFESGSALGLDTSNAVGGTFDYGLSLANPNGGANALGLTKLGGNTLALTGTNTYTGPTLVSEGTLKVEGSITSAVTVLASGTLGGSGTTGSVSARAGSTIAPGTNLGTLSTGDFNLESGSQLSIEFGGTAAGTEYDQVSVNGTITLAGDLQISLVNGFVPAYGDKFFVMINDGIDSVSGTFAGLPQGAIANFGGLNLAVSYQGDWASQTATGGNDVVLVAVPEPDSVAMLLFAFGAQLFVQRIRSRVRSRSPISVSSARNSRTGTSSGLRG